MDRRKQARSPCPRIARRGARRQQRACLSMRRRTLAHAPGRVHGGARGLLPCGEKEIGRPPSGACGGPAAWNFCGVGKYLRTPRAPRPAPRAERRAAGARQAAARDEAGRIGAEANATRPDRDLTANRLRTNCGPHANRSRSFRAAVQNLRIRL
ncbi:hypothetical protein BP354A_5591 [Burkholderia pseudomallei 354a]|nr:hypothetical protein BP354A_5591 [Burkholderia pseudomallei 354a]